MFHLKLARESEKEGEKKCASWERQGRELLKKRIDFFYKRTIIPFRVNTHKDVPTIRNHERKSEINQEREKESERVYVVVLNKRIAFW